MLRRVYVLASIGFVLSTLTATAAAVTFQRTFVASTGNDVNPCSLALPCRSFNAAIVQTSAGGEVVILDTAGYGPMTITQSIKIIGPSGVYGGISVQGGAGPTTGIVINAGANDVITLRGLDVSGVPGSAPLPNIGIDVQNAAAVHIEKTSIGNFTQDTSACINVNVANATRVYVNDSFLRECRNGIYANSSAVAPSASSVIVDNTRIERGVNTSGSSTVTAGVWLQGFITVSLRNSLISRETNGVQFDNLLSAHVSHLDLINSEITRSTAGIVVSNTSASAHAQVEIAGSQLVEDSDAITFALNAVGGTSTLLVTDSTLAYTLNSGITLANTTADANTELRLEMTRSQIHDITVNGLALSATSGGRTNAFVRDSGFGNTGTAIKTSGGGGYLSTSLIRSNINGSTTAIDHGFGIVRLDGSHVVYNNKDFVNSGSGTIVSNGYNMVYDNINPVGPTYITPAKITLE